MDGDRPSAGTPAGPGEPPDSELVEARAAVEWHFGDLVDQAARDHPVTKRRLAWTLAAVECEARRRELRLRSAGDPVECDAPGIVLRLPGGTWQALERERELSDRESVAVRDIHRRMAEAVAGDPDTGPGTNLFVLCGESDTGSV